MQIKKYASRQTLETFARLALVAAIAPLLCSCALVQLKHQVTELEQHGAIGVVLSPLPGRSFPTHAFAWTRAKSGELEIAGFQPVGDIGIASFDLITNHVYGIAVFTDENQSGKYERGEPLAFQENVRPAQFTDASTPLQVLTLALTRQHRRPPIAVTKMPKENPALGMALRASLGEVVPLKDPRFSKASGSDGMWRPSDFLSDNTLGVYFTEPYDPNRTPVLFVHGIGGSPRDFSYMMAHFDSARYQLWFFHYPSGLRLGRLSAAMAKGLEVLHQRHGFQEGYIVAHSMGGLVSADGIRAVGLAQETNFITKFVTISSPFGGHEAAKLALRHLDKPVPSWIDVAPQSEFLANLAHASLPAGTRYDLIYGEKGRDDGVVTVASQLEARNLAKASSVTSFPFGHEQILNEPVVVKRVLECLQVEAGQTNPEAASFLTAYNRHQ